MENNTAKKTRPAAKKAVAAKKTTANGKQLAHGWFNMVAIAPDGREMPLQRGFGIFAEGEYVDPKAVALVDAAAKKPEGEMTIMMRVTIRPNKPVEDVGDVSIFAI